MNSSSRRSALQKLSAFVLTGFTGAVSTPGLSQNAEVATPRWRTPQDLVQIGLRRSRVLMMNEAHSGPKRCIRTREVGISVIPAAHAAGARYLAMEALSAESAAIANRDRKLPGLDSAYGPYLNQPEMRDFIQSALSLGWTLIPYEADLTQAAKITDPMALLSWRDEQQGRNLSNAVKELSSDARILVWCGLSHLSRAPAGQYRPMGLQFADISGIRPFAIDQTVTINTGTRASATELVQRFKNDLDRFGGTAGFLTEEGFGQFRSRPDVDAFIFSTENEME